MNEKYYVIRNSDGDTTVDEFTKEQLLKAIQENYWGTNGSEDILTELPENTDTNYWGEGLLIIKGSVVVPTPKQIVTKYDIE